MIGLIYERYFCGTTPIPRTKLTLSFACNVLPVEYSSWYDYRRDIHKRICLNHQSKGRYICHANYGMI